jgi:hypothetical protein
MKHSDSQSDLYLISLSHGDASSTDNLTNINAGTLSVAAPAEGMQEVVESVTTAPSGLDVAVTGTEVGGSVTNGLSLMDEELAEALRGIQASGSSDSSTAVSSNLLGGLSWSNLVIGLGLLGAGLAAGWYLFTPGSATGLTVTSFIPRLPFPDSFPPHYTSSAYS